MAIVANKADGGIGIVDKSYETYTRTNAGTPNATLTPAFAGEIVWDTTNKVRWVAVNKLNTGWRSMDIEVT